MTNKMSTRSKIIHYCTTYVLLGWLTGKRTYDVFYVYTRIIIIFIS